MALHPLLDLHLRAPFQGDERDSMLVEFVAQSAHAVGQESRPAGRRSFPVYQPRVNDENRRPLVHAFEEGIECPIVADPKIVPKPMQTSHEQMLPGGVSSADAVALAGRPAFLDGFSGAMGSSNFKVSA